jgi:predicted DNA-binding transcriptional regulator AlpA
MKKSITLQGQTFDAGEVLIQRYGISAMTLWRWVKRGLLPPPIKLGRRNYYERREVEARLFCGE